MHYQIHDYEIDSLIVENDRIILSFPKGFYAEDENGQALKPLRKKLVFIIDKDNFPDDPPESFLSIRRINRRRNGWKEISLKKFSSLFKKGNMVIHDQYDSRMTNWKMLQLNTATSRSNIEIMMTDVIAVECFA